MAKILMLTLVYGPDTVSTANMMTDIAQGLQETGHDVTVLTSIPHYNPSSEVRGNPLYRASLRHPYTESYEEGVRVLRVLMPLKRQKIWTRGFDYLLFQLLTTMLALVLVGGQDVVFVTSPPITLGLSGIAIAKLRGGAFVYDVRELWPDVPVRIGLFRHPILVRFIYALEVFVYRRAMAISTIARSFQRTLVERGVPQHKLHFTPNFVDVNYIKPGPKDNSFSAQYELINEFVILYAGNIGLTQGLEIMIEVAATLIDDSNVQFVIVGDGAARPQLEQLATEANLSNVRLLPFQPVHLVREMYATADICIAPLRRGFSYDTVPSKIYTAMAAGRPVIASAENNTETAMLLRESRAGLCVPPESVATLSDEIRELRSNPEKGRLLGANGRRWIELHYSRETIITAYDKMMQDITVLSD